MYQARSNTRHEVGEALAVVDDLLFDEYPP